MVWTSPSAHRVIPSLCISIGISSYRYFRDEISNWLNIPSMKHLVLFLLLRLGEVAGLQGIGVSIGLCP